MSTLTRGRRFRIIDDFLPEDELVALRALAAGLPYERRASVIDAAADGEAERSRGAVLWRQEVLQEAGPGPTPPAAYRSVVEELDRHPDLVGRGDVDWAMVGLGFWRYAAGSRLGWHNDARADRRGEFILFLHDTWMPSWGGELLLLDRDPADLPPAPAGLSPFAAVEHQVAATPDALVAVVPRPNRLVIVQEGTSHCIHRVDRTAGEHLRWTMTGFVGTALTSSARPDETSRAERLAPFLVSSAPASEHRN